MLAATDNVRVAPTPGHWRVRELSIAGGVLGACDLAFSVGVLMVGKCELGLDLPALRTLSVVTLIFSGQAILYVVRERRHFWRSRPSLGLLVASTADILIISTLAACGVWMTPLPVGLLAGLLGATALFGWVLDFVKVPLFRRLGIR